MSIKSNAAVARISMVLWLAACGGSAAGPADTAGSAGTAVVTGGAGAPAGLGGAGAPAGPAGSLAADGGRGGMLGVAAAGAAAIGGAGAAGLAAGSGAAGAVAAAGAGGAGSAGKAGGTAAGSGGSAAGAFALTSPVVKEGELLPADYRCAKPSPALTWTPGPAGTMSYAIVFKDTTAGGFSMGYMHWTIYDIPASVTSLPMGVPMGASLSDPAGAKQGQNYQNANAFTGPCGGMNTYRFTLYALSVATLPGLSASSKGAQVEAAAEGSSKLASTALNIRSMP
jgi:Raf kinase inhibitor-like YbhB/YbcL family protein